MKKRILIIEDESRLIRALKEKLLREDFEVLTALTGEDGLNIIIKDKPDLILLDIFLPKMHGDEVMAEIEKNPEISKIPVIVVTNSGDPTEVERFKKMGAIDYVVKADFRISEIIDKVKKILQ
jgi:DNA-binding response OmpR family regulator